MDDTTRQATARRLLESALVPDTDDFSLARLSDVIFNATYREYSPPVGAAPDFGYDADDLAAVLLPLLRQASVPKPDPMAKIVCDYCDVPHRELLGTLRCRNPRVVTS